MKKDLSDVSQLPAPDSTVTEIVRRAEAMGIDPARVIRALDVPAPPAGVPHLEPPAAV